MKRIRISLRFLLCLVAAFAMVLAVDQRTESTAIQFVDSITKKPEELLPHEIQPKWVAVENVATEDTTTFIDRVLFRRRISIHYDMYIVDYEKEMSFYIVVWITTFRVSLLGSNPMD